MNPGGAERALIGLMSTIDYDRYQVDLFLNRHEGVFLSDIPKEVNLLPENCRYSSLTEPIYTTLKRGQVDIVLGRMVAKIASKIKQRGQSTDGGISGDYSHRFTSWMMPKINKEIVYDLAISFITPHYFVSRKIRARRKVAWIHTDYKQIHLDIKSQLQMWSKYDCIVAVSESVANNFKHVFPSLASRVQIIENILPYDLIMSQAYKEIDDFSTEGQLRLLSIGRFTYAKNLESIPLICRKLIDKGLPICWYIIGYGDREEQIRKSILEQHVEREVIILGQKRNPYPYIFQCDLYIQPSRYEGKAITVREAQLLCKPVIIADYPTAENQLKNGIDGIIAPQDVDEFSAVIERLIREPSIRDFLTDNCRLEDIACQKEINKIYDLIEER